MSIAETNVRLLRSEDALAGLADALQLIVKNGVEKNEMSKCLRVMVSIIVAEGERGDVEAAFTMNEKIVQTAN